MYGHAAASTSHVSAATGANAIAAVSSATAPIAWLSRASATSQFQNVCWPADASTMATAAALSPDPPLPAAPRRRGVHESSADPDQVRSAASGTPAPAALCSSSTGGWPSWPSSDVSRPNIRSTVQSTTRRSWRLIPGIIIRW
jgi:hypothetical protein